MMFEKPKLLITAELPGTDDIAMPLISAFNNLHITLLGYNRVPEQTSPEQARDKYEKEAEAALKKMADQLAARAVQLDTRLIFTGNVPDSVQRVVAEEAIDAVLALRPLSQIDTILVPLHSDQQQPEHVAAFVAALVRNSTIQVQLRLLHASDIDGEKAETLMQRQQHAFAQTDIDDGLIDIAAIETAEPVNAIIDLATDGDVMILGEADPSVRERIFGTVHERIVPHVECPVVLVLYKEN